jgi:hypothetical protein
MAQQPSDSAGTINQDAVIARLLVQVGGLAAQLEKLQAENTALKAEDTTLRARVAELEAKLGQPPKTPANSSTPPSQGRKASDGRCCMDAAISVVWAGEAMEGRSVELTEWVPSDAEQTQCGSPASFREDEIQGAELGVV